jgi:hypothetical protein
MGSMGQLRVQRGLPIAALSSISRSTFSFMRLCRWASPPGARANAFAAAFLLASFVANGSAFLAFSIMAEKRGITTTRQGQKSIYYLAGIAEGFETIAFMIAFCLFPTAFPILAIIFATLCWISALSRLVLGWKLLAAEV